MSAVFYRDIPTGWVGLACEGNVMIYAGEKFERVADPTQYEVDKRILNGKAEGMLCDVISILDAGSRTDFTEIGFLRGDIFETYPIPAKNIPKIKEVLDSMPRVHYMFKLGIEGFQKYHMQHFYIHHPNSIDTTMVLNMIKCYAR